MHGTKIHKHYQAMEEDALFNSYTTHKGFIIILLNTVFEIESKILKHN